MSRRPVCPAGQGQKPGKHVQRTNASQFADVALDQRFEVVAIPCGTSARSGTCESRRVAPGHDALGEFRPKAIYAASLEGTGEEGVEKVRPPAGELALRERVETQDLHAAGKRLGDCGEQQDVRRAREQEAARCAVAIDGQLEGAKSSFQNTLAAILQQIKMQPSVKSAS